MNAHHQEILLPDLGLDRTVIKVSCWLVPLGKSVVKGDRLLEVLAGDATVDLSAPTNGVLVTQHVDEDDHLRVGQVLGIIRSTNSDS